MTQTVPEGVSLASRNACIHVSYFVYVRLIALNLHL